MPTTPPPLPPTPPTFTQHSDAPAQAVSRQFASRPSLRAVFGQMLQKAIKEQYPPLDLDVQLTRLAVPNLVGGWDLKRLLDVALDYVGSGTLLDTDTVIDGRRCFLTNRAPHPLTYEAEAIREPDLQLIKAKILDLTPTLMTVFQDALTDYWNQPGDTGPIRWQWLGDLLATGLSSTASLLPAEYQQQQAALHHLTAYPDQRTRPTPVQGGVHAYCLETSIVQGSHTANIMEPELLVVQAQNVMLYRSNGTLEFHDSLEAFTQARGRDLSRQVLADSVTIKRYEPDGNSFDTLAALLLNQQLEALGTVVLPASDGLNALEQRIADTTDPTPWFIQAPAPSPTFEHTLQANLPVWLQTATPGDRFAYRQQLAELARVHRQTAGASFLDGVENLHDFTRNTLLEQIHADHPEVTTIDPDDLELTFHVPVGDLGSGYLTPVSMSLTQLAIKNLAAAPQGSLTLRSKSGATIPAWMSADYLLGEKGLFTSTQGLIARTNIGERYPTTLRALLLGNDSEAQRREALFDQALRVRLPLQALEHKIRGEHGMTWQGYRYVQALMQRSAADRVVDDLSIVIHALAFHRTPHSKPDVVNNMFIIEASDRQVGPHILYRPLYPDSLRQFASRDALLGAIAEPGPLQDSVLSWLPDHARPIYSNNGFVSPHIIRFGQGDDTVQWPAPAPAQLADDSNGDAVLGSLAQSLAAGNLTQYLYGSNARALVDLADRDAVSNAESRWAILLEGGWLLFNALLLPLLRGPAMVAGWMVQLAVSLQHDLEALHGDDPVARELAWVDVLLNIGLLLIHRASAQHPSIEPAFTPAKPPVSKALSTLLRRPPTPSAHVAPKIEQGPVGLPSEPPASDRTEVDFIHSTARDGSRRRLFNALLEHHVAWPVPAPSPVELGAFKGLYRIGQQWHASVAGLLFQVSIVPDAGEVFIVNPQKNLHPGFKLSYDGQGRWALDLGLKLRGGGPKNRLKAKLAQIEQQRAEAWLKVTRLESQILEQIDQTAHLFDTVTATKKQFEVRDRELAHAMQRLRLSPNDPSAVSAHAVEARNRTRARLHFLVAYEKYAPVTEQLQQNRRAIIDAYAQVKAADGKFDYESSCLEQYQTLLAAQEVDVSFLASLHTATFVSDRGELMNDLLRMERDEPANQRLLDMTEMHFATSERHAQSLIAIDMTLEEMANRLKTGPAERLKFLNAMPHRRFYNRLCAIVEPLDLLAALSIDELREPATAQEEYFMARLETLHFPQVSVEHSYIDLLTTQGFTSAERKEVLVNVIEHYSRRLQAYRMLMELDSTLLRPRYMPLLIERLETLRAAAETDLADVLREDEFLPAQFVRFKPAQLPSPTKRVFRSRDKGTLVGNLLPPDAEMPFPTIVVKNPLTDEISARFMEHPHEGWVEIVDAPPQRPAPVPRQRALATLRTEAQRLIDQITALEKSIEFQKRKLADPQRRDDVNPQDWNDMFGHQARKIEAIADEIQAHHLDKPDVPQALERLRMRATDLRRQGEQHCIEGYKAQRPRQENIDYLRRHAAVDIGLVHGPQRTAANDYVSEFAIREKNRVDVLWYAHFHYSSADSPRGDYTAAHLKRPEHRFTTFKDLIAKAGPDSHVIVNDLYSPINRPLDQQLFLVLIPE